MDPVTTGAFSYPDSVDSSPRSRGGESWDEPYPAGPGPKLRLMCSYGGRIVPRPTDKSLCYLGGETRIVVVDRNSSLSELHSKLSRSLSSVHPFTLKYQLPNEDLDSLISLTTDEDLDNMIDEYDRIQQSSHHATNPSAAAGGGGGSNKSSRIRLFLFPTKPESAPSSIGSLLDDSKSETWFVDALNGAMGIGIDGLPTRGSTDSASVNCLLGLEDDSSFHSRAGGGSHNAAGGGAGEADRMVLPQPDSSGKLGRLVQDVNSVPNSPMLDTTSSFGSASSVPSLANLPPIRVRPNEPPPDGRYGNLDEHFQQMNLNLSSTVQSPTVNPPPTTISPSENPNSNRAFGSDEEKSDIGKAPPPPQQVSSQLKPVQIEPTVADSRQVYYQERMMPAAAAAAQLCPEPQREIPVPDPTAAYRVQQMPMPVPESNYVMPTISSPEQLDPQLHPQVRQQQQQQQQQQHHQLLQQQQQQQHHHQLQQQQQQYIQAHPQYVQYPTTYYHQVHHPIQQSQPFDPSIPMYYIPVRQNPPPVSAKPELQPAMYRSSGAPTAQMIHPGMGYHMMHHHQPSQAPAAGPGPQIVNYGYEYMGNAAAPDTGHQAQVYYTQATSAPSMSVQYQTVVSEEMKQNRPS